MRLDRRFAVVVGISLLWALLVSAAFYRVAKSRAAQPSTGRQRSVVVAAQAFAIGAVIGPGSVKLIRVPDDLTPKGSFSRAEDVVGRPVISPIQPEEPIVEARLGSRGTGGGVAPLIPEGMRAISVRVNDVVGVAGFVLPGMRVDVLVTVHPPGRDDTVTTTVLQNIAVLSVGQTLQIEANSQSIKAAVVTLLVSPPQAEALTLADNEGHIQLVLRNSADHQTAPTTGWQLHQLYGRGRTETAPAQPQAAKVVVATPKPSPLVPTTIPKAVEEPADGVLMIRGNQKVIEVLSPKPGDAR